MSTQYPHIIAGVTLYYYFAPRLFEIAPELQELFSFHDEEVSEENESLKKHAVQVMESVGMAIGLLHDPKALVSTLTELGIVHHLHQVQLDSFGVSASQLA